MEVEFLIAGFDKFYIRYINKKKLLCNKNNKIIIYYELIDAWRNNLYQQFEK